MSIGDDIKNDVLQDLGTSFTILRDSGDVTGEKLLYELNAQATKPFIREFFLEAEFAYDTSVVPGDVLQFNNDGREFLVMNKTPEHFEDAAIEQAGVLYKVNVSGELLRPSGEIWDDQYHKVSQWETIRSNCRALMTEALYGHALDVEEELGMIELEKHELYIPDQFGAQVGDRYVPVSGEYYQLTTIKSRRYPGVNVFELQEDTRQ